MTELDQSILNLLSRGRLSVGAFWTADIAYLLNQPHSQGSRLPAAAGA